MPCTRGFFIKYLNRIVSQDTSRPRLAEIWFYGFTTVP